jgi:hypothetical protein
MQHSASFRFENSNNSTEIEKSAKAEICPWSSSIHHCLSFKAAAEFLKVQTPSADVETKEIKKGGDYYSKVRLHVR